LEFLIEIGIVVRGSWEEYKKRPLFININDTESPLRINRQEAAIIEALVDKCLPVFILPMPLSGISSPVTLVSNVMIGVAEILGTWTAVKSVDPRTPVQAGIGTGTLDPRTGSPAFSAPETILQDLAVAQLFRWHYKIRCSVNIGVIDAAYPGTSAALERCFKIMAAAGGGEVNYPVGILEAGKTFSPEQAMIDLDLAKEVYRFYSGIIIDDDRMATGLIRERGPGSVFLDEEHTVKYFRDEIWIPDLFDRSKSAGLRENRKSDIVVKAHEKWKSLLAHSQRHHLPDDKAREIDRIVARAEKILTRR